MELLCQVDFLQTYNVARVNVTGRAILPDRFVYHEVRIGEVNSLLSEPANTQLAANPACGPDSGPGPNWFFLFECGPGGLNGRYLTLQNVNGGVLGIDEIEVF